MTAPECPVILTYHSISEDDSALAISPSLFTKQMNWLKGNAHVLPLAEIVSALLQCRTLPKRSVAITFDDGFLDFFTSAAPVLTKLSLPATIFLVAAYCGRTNRWPGQPRWIREQLLLGWKEIAELSKSGFDFGGHSLNHPVLTGMPFKEAMHEIAACKIQIEQQTNKQVEFFAYPYGRWNRSVRDLVAQNYRGACSTGAGVIKCNADPFALPRVDAHYVRHPAAYQLLFTESFLVYLAFRRFVRRLRGQPEGRYAHFNPSF